MHCIIIWYNAGGPKMQSELELRHIFYFIACLKFARYVVA